jgi:putative acetyltransferase
MISLVRTTSENPDFVALVRLLDADLARRDGEEHAFFAQYNGIALLKHVVVLFVEGLAVGCGAIKEIAPGVAEVKRMYVREEARGQGHAGRVLAALEGWAGELGFGKCILETGIRQTEAIALYTKSGYARIPNYGQYAEVASSVCFEKVVG